MIHLELYLPEHGARPELQVHQRRAARGSRGGTGPVRAPGQRDALPFCARSLRQPAAHIAPIAQSAIKQRISLTTLFLNICL